MPPLHHARRAFSWTGNPAVYPLWGAIVVGLSALVTISTRKLLADPTVTFNRKSRQEADYPEHGLERAVHYRDSDPFSKLGKAKKHEKH